jgi:hypothetical protein
MPKETIGRLPGLFEELHVFLIQVGKATPGLVYGSTAESIIVNGIKVKAHALGDIDPFILGAVGVGREGLL